MAGCSWPLLPPRRTLHSCKSYAAARCTEREQRHSDRSCAQSGNRVWQKSSAQSGSCLIVSAPYLNCLGSWEADGDEVDNAAELDASHPASSLNRIHLAVCALVPALLLEETSKMVYSLPLPLYLPSRCCSFRLPALASLVAFHVVRGDTGASGNLAVGDRYAQ